LSSFGYYIYNNVFGDMYHIEYINQARIVDIFFNLFYVSKKCTSFMDTWIMESCWEFL